MTAAAHLRISSDTLGDVALHLRIQDGAAHIRMEGPSRSAIEARAPELARALAAEGIGLARIEIQPRTTGDSTTGNRNPDPGAGQQQDRAGADPRSPQQQRQPDEPQAEERASQRPAARTATTTRARNHAGAHDVTA